MDYGAGENCRTILQDHRGVIYIGNDQGILEFDGVNWNLIPNADRSRVQSLCIDRIPSPSTKERPVNRIYVGSSGDIGYLAVDSTGSLAYRSLLHVIPEDYRNFGLVHQVIAIDEGVVFQTGNYLFLYQRGKIKVFQPQQGSGFHFAHSINGKLYVTQNETGPWQLRENKLELVDKPLIKPGMYIMDMSFLSDSVTMVMTYEDGFFLFDGSDFRPWQVPANDLIKQFKCYRVEYSPNSDIIVQTVNNGMFWLNEQGEIVSAFNEANGRGEFVSYDLLFDRLGNLWTVHSTGITFLELATPFSLYDQYTGLIGRGVSSDVYDGSLYVSTTKGLFSMPWGAVNSELSGPRDFQPVSVPKNLSIYLSSVGNSLFISFVDGLYIQNSQGSQIFPEEPVGRMYKIIRLQQDSSWVLCTSSIGLVLFENVANQGDPPNWILRKRFEELQGDHLDLEEGPPGTFWMTKPFGGFWRFGLDLDKQQLLNLRTFGPDSGLPISGMNKVFKLDEKVIFTTLEGMYRFEDSLERFYPDSTFNSSLRGRVSIFNLREDDDDNIWVWSENSSRLGLEGGKRLQLLAPTSNQNNLVGYENFDRLFHKVKRNLSERPEITPMDDGVLFSSDHGLIHYDPNTNFDISTSFNSLISKVHVTSPANFTVFGGVQANEFGVPDTTLDFIHHSALPYRNNGLRFTCSALYPLNPEDLHFRFFLKGNDPTWSGWTGENSKEYSNLKEGTYTFHVQARNVFETESRISTYTFTISPPWHRSWLAYGLYVLASVGLIWLIVKINTRRLRRDKERLEDTVKVRTAELRQTNEKLVEMDQFKQGMTSMIVHDLKNPLNSIINVPESLTSENKVQVMKNSGKQMLNMVMNILDLDKYEESKMMPDLVETAISDVTERSFAAVEYLSQQKNISLKNELSSGILVLADHEILERVITNLLTNAIKFTPVSGHIRVYGEHVEKEMIKVLVEDTGEGIPPEKLDSVFQRFGQVIAKRSGGVRSTGLGLTFCKMAVEAHGGDIGVKSKVGEGSTFWFTLKIAEGVVEQVSDRPQEEKSDHDIPLSQEDLLHFKEVARILESIPVYKVTQIREVLRDHHDKPGRIHEEILKAVNTGDQKKYEALIYQILHEGE